MRAGTALKRNNANYTCTLNEGGPDSVGQRKEADLNDILRDVGGDEDDFYAELALEVGVIRHRVH